MAKGMLPACPVLRARYRIWEMAEDDAEDVARRGLVLLAAVRWRAR